MPVGRKFDLEIIRREIKLKKLDIKIKDSNRFMKIILTIKKLFI